jgi:hypothetical protein
MLSPVESAAETVSGRFRRVLGYGWLGGFLGGLFLLGRTATATGAAGCALFLVVAAIAAAGRAAVLTRRRGFALRGFVFHRARVGVAVFFGGVAALFHVAGTGGTARTLFATGRRATGGFVFGGLRSGFLRRAHDVDNAEKRQREAEDENFNFFHDCVS